MNLNCISIPTKSLSVNVILLVMLCSCCIFADPQADEAAAAAMGLERDEKKIYVVYLGSTTTDNQYSPTMSSMYHVAMLEEVKGMKGSYTLVGSYNRSFYAFAAMLTDEEAEALRGKEGVVYVFENKVNKIQTTMWCSSEQWTSSLPCREQCAEASSVAATIVDRKLFSVVELAQELSVGA